MSSFFCNIAESETAVLVGCEESGIVTRAFRDQGISAYSCDIKPTRGNAEWHIQNDIMNVIPVRKWDMIILHPDCTALAVSGNRWYGRGMEKHQDRIDAIKWTKELWDLSKKYSCRVVLENPVSVIFQYLDYHSLQYIQPWQYGHGETKRTGLALWNVPPLLPVEISSGREQKIWKMPPSPNRKRDRSTTFTGVARAMANQWASMLETKEPFPGETHSA